MIKRLIEFYQRNAASTDAMQGDIWRGVTWLYAPFCAALKAGDEAQVQAFLDTCGPTNRLYGLECGKLYTFDDSWCLPYVQKLANLTGVLPYRHPNQATGNQWKASDVAATVASIEHELGFKLCPPHCFGFSGEGAPLRMMIYHAAAALTIRRLIGVPNHILEIGAGLGNLGYIAKQWGVKTYTVLDLPHIAVLSAYFASKYCDEREITFGPDWWAYGKREAPPYDLIFNCDSLPEMPASAQDDYILLIHDRLALNGRFLSINHEGDRDGQSSVLAAVKRHGGLRLASRHPFPMMDGYVEELYVRNKGYHV